MNGPRQGAATMPRVNPMKRVPKYPPKFLAARLVRPAGMRNSQKPKKLNANAMRIAATITSTMGLWSAEPSIPPERAAVTPRTELVMASPRI